MRMVYHKLSVEHVDDSTPTDFFSNQSKTYCIKVAVKTKQNNLNATLSTP